ncbi:DUF3303 domain-containing protein [Geodermatophilus sp. SYSU D01105]
MKYLLEWKSRSGASAQENLVSLKRSLEVFSKWTPATTVHQFLSRVDGSGGFAVLESDDPTAVGKDCAIFSPYLEFTLHPVVDVQEGAALLQQAVDFNETV